MNAKIKTEQSLKASVSKNAGVTVISMAGPLDDTTASAAQEQIRESMAAGQRVVLDLSEVTCNTEAGLRILRSAFRQAQHRRVRIGVSGLSSDLGNVLGAVGLIPHIVVDNDVRACARSVRKESA